MAASLGAQASSAPDGFSSFSPAPQMALLDFFIPGFSVFSGAVQRYLHVDLNLYIPLVLLCGGLTFVWRYCSENAWGLVESYLMSVVDVRTDDEIYNMLMAWVATQRFAQGARRFVVNTNLNSRSWFLWRWSSDDDEDEESTEPGKQKKKALAYTPTFGSHWFWYKGRLLIFRRHQNREQASFLVASEREEISISCFGRNPWVLKELLHEARTDFMKRDEAKTLIYRGTTKGGTAEPTWQRCMARTSRPFSTVILNEKVKKELIDDVTEYLNPATRRWYANRGIPYRRGYLLYGPPGTGKSSLSLALAGFFKMRIYIVSLSSVTANEENLSSLFAELPRKCVVLLEDIDTAGLTHTREDGKPADNTANPASDMVPGQKTPGNSNNTTAGPLVGRLSLSGLLNILDGVASQEGRVLIMTTNHVEKLDKALIRPGRVDMIVKFDRADKGMTAAIFRAIYAPLEGDDAPAKAEDEKLPRSNDPEEEKKKAGEKVRKAEIMARVNRLAEEFAEKIPDREFSPAEIQGYLLKNKRSPETAVEGAEQWVVNTRKEKEKDAEEKQKAEEEEKKKKKQEEEGEKKKQEEEGEKKKKEKKESKRKSKKSSRRNKSRKNNKDSDSSDSSDDSSSSESESEVEKEKTKKSAKKRSKPAEDVKVPAAEVAIVVETPAAEAPAAQTTLAIDTRPREELAVDEGKHGSDSGYGTPRSADFEKAEVGSP